LQVLLSLVVPHVQWSELSKAEWGAVPGTLPIIALAFVYQNVVPVVVKDLEGDMGKVCVCVCVCVHLSAGLGCLAVGF
jgi:tyrosine-specific transport protein